jgi:hypothetical protein
LRLKAKLVTFRLHSPTLQTDIVRSAQQQAVTPPKIVEPVTASFPEGTSPETAMVRGPAGSLLSTATVADLDPELVGAKRIGADRKFPGAILNG